MRPSLLALFLLALLASACSRPAGPATPYPEPELPPASDRAPSEEEVRNFLRAENDELRAAERADSILARLEGYAVESEGALFDPADFDIPIEYNERVQYWIDYFETRGRSHFETYLARMGRFDGMIRSMLRERGMPEDLIYLAMIESGFSPVARSHASAVGVWQFIAGTGRRYGLEISTYVDERRDPIKATGAALDYLQDLYDRFGSWYLAAAAYNTGENRVERLLRQHAGGARGDDALYWKISPRLHTETRNYVPKMIAAAILGRYRERHGFGHIVPEMPLAYEVVRVPDATEFAVLAEAAGVDEDAIRQLNPQFPRGLTPPGRAVEVRVPAGRGEAFTVAYAQIPPNQRVRTLEHTIRRGETLSGIAKLYGTTVRSLQDINGIRNPNSIRAGQRLIVRVGPGATVRPPTQTASAPAASRTATTTRSNDASTTPANTVRYTVRGGDTLWEIARRYGVDVDELRSWNQLGANSTIRPGQVLALQPRAEVLVYRVQPGDTLWEIARRHGVTTERLIAWNNLPGNGLIRPGDQVEVPVDR